MLLKNYYLYEWVRNAYVFNRYNKGSSEGIVCTTANAKTADGSAVYRMAPYTHNEYYPTVLHGGIYKEVASQTTIPSAWTSSGPFTSNLVIGSGTTAPTPDDYKLENEITTLSYVNVTGNYNYQDGTITIIKHMTNTSTDIITVSEVGLVILVSANSDYATTSLSARTLMYYREVLETPIEVPAGASFAVTITHQLPMSA